MKDWKDTVGWAVAMLGIVLAAIILLLLLLLVASWIFQFAWNLFLPSVFGLKQISFMESLGAIILLGFVRGIVKVVTTK